MSTEQLDGSRGDLSYKYQRLRERLRTAVKTGELTGKLPGERTLARRYSANAKTINKALNDLAMEGLILRHVGRGTFVAGSGPSRKIPAMPSRCYAWLAPGSVDPADHDQLFALTRDLLKSRGHRLECLKAELNGSEELPESALTPRTLRQVDGVFIFSGRPSRELLASLRRRHLPVVLVDNHHQEIRLPAVLPDQSHAAFVLSERFIQSGHRRIQLVFRPRSLPGAGAARSGYQAAMQYYGLAPLPVLEVGFAFDWSVVTSTESRPTALLCVAGDLAIAARRKLDQADVAVPAEMSLAAICSPGESCVETEAITSYEFDPRRVFHWAAEFITQGQSSHGPQIAVVPGHMVDRGSIAAPPGARESPPRPSSETTF